MRNKKQFLVRLGIVIIGVMLGTIAKAIIPPPPTNGPPKMIKQIDKSESGGASRLTK